MIEELIFTSSERGLQIGKSGFCTVASTSEMASNLTRMLESLSGYRHLFTPGTPEAAQNPVVYSFLQVKVGGEQRHVISRVADAGVDYSGRSNKLAHHVSMPVKSQKTAGPTRLLLDKQFFCTQWEGEPKELKPRPLLDKVSAPKACKFWQKITGDAGWAGELIEVCQTGKTIYLIIEPTTPAAALLHEALSLLPQQQQWQTTFSSFYRRLPPNVQCQIRCVMADSPEIEMTRQSPNNVVWDLTKPLGTPTSHLADHARLGKTITGRESRPVEATEEKSVDDKAPIATPKPTQKAKVPSLGGKRPPELPDALQINEGVAGKTKGGWLIPAISALGLLAVATGCAVMFVPGLQEKFLSIFSPSLPPDVVKPGSTEPVVDPLPVPHFGSVDPDRVFARMIPPPVLTPPINSKPIVDPKSIVDPKPLVDPIDQTPVIDKANLLSARDISFAPQWQSFQKSRFPQPILLIRHTTPIAESIQIDFSGGPSEIEMKNSSEGNWEVMASGRQVGNLKLVDDEQGSQLEFQCELDNSGAPTVFLDAIDQLNQCVLEIRTGNLPLTKFEVATQLIQGHIDLDNRRKHEDLAFGVGGESLTQTLAGHDVAIRLLPEISPVLSTPSPEDENQTSGPPEAGKEETDNDQATQGEMLLTIPLPFDKETIQDYSPIQMKRFEELNARVNLRVFKDPGQPIRYQWQSLSFTVLETEVTARSWKFEHHPIDVVTRELKKQLKSLGRGPVGPRDIKGGLEEIIEFLQDAKTQTSKTLEVTELMPNRLASPIELKTDNNLRYLVFIDIGQQGQLWSPEEMRLSHHGFPHTETN